MDKKILDFILECFPKMIPQKDGTLDEQNHYWHLNSCRIQEETENLYKRRYGGGWARRLRKDTICFNWGIKQIEEFGQTNLFIELRNSEKNRIAVMNQLGYLLD